MANYRTCIEIFKTNGKNNKKDQTRAEINMEVDTEVEGVPYTLV